MRRPSDAHRWFAALYWMQRVWEPLGYARHRRALARGVRGVTLEVGVGTGFSLPYYASPPAVAIDPSFAMARRARARAERLGIKLPVVVAAGEALPFADATFDTVLSQSVLCSAADPAGIAREVRRALGPAGSWRFVDHGRSARAWYRRVQRAIAPGWRRLAGGCRLDGDPVAAVESAGFEHLRVRRCNGGAVARGTATRGEAADRPGRAVPDRPEAS